MRTDGLWQLGGTTSQQNPNDSQPPTARAILRSGIQCPDRLGPFATTTTMKKLAARFLCCCLAGTTLGSISLWTDAVAAEEVLYAFRGGSDGLVPYGALIGDQAGNLYGTTYEGGGGASCGSGCGTIFTLSSDRSESLLYAFAGNCDGAYPTGRLTEDDQGNFFGTTFEGGTCNSAGYGTVFKLMPDNTESVVYAFRGGSDGAYPTGDLIEDDNGSVLGTTSSGGDSNFCENFGCGVVFRVDSSGAETVLYAFQGGGDGGVPTGAPIMDGAGNLYGVTQLGGTINSICTVGCGVVYKLTPDGAEQALYAFQGGEDGSGSRGNLLLDNSGNLYGTTEFGGGTGCVYNLGCGTVFKVTPDGMESILHRFQGGLDGNAPVAGLIMDAKGNLFGTTALGGNLNCDKGGGCGTVFKVSASGRETVLVSFRKRYGREPVAALLAKKGYLYGTTTSGGLYKQGVVFRVKK
jgi:uncharacterized repeat protein (TIGR03803 family)